MFSNWKNLKKWIAIGSFILLIISIIPLLYVAQYNHPTGDDFYYGLQPHLVWEDTGSFWQTVLSALKGTAHYYNIWQGTFSAMFIMHLQPAVFSEGAYVLTTYIVLGSILFGSAFLWRQVTGFFIPADKYDALGIWSITLSLLIQCVFGIGEGFYWFNGAVYYSAFFGIMLWMFGLIIKYLYVGGLHRYILAIFFAVLLGGSNYITLLFSLITLFLASVYLFYLKHKQKWHIITLFFIMAGCLLISASAPGNALRQATAAGLPAYKAIIFSIISGLRLVVYWLDMWWCIGAILLLPFFVSIIKRMTFRFPYPIIAVGFLFGLFCSMICPTMYAQSNTGPVRAVNLYRYGFIILTYIALFYCLGWLMQKYKLPRLVKYSNSIHWAGILVFIVYLTISIINTDIMNLAAAKAIADIYSGTAQAYDAEYQERLQALNGQEPLDLVFKPFQNRPYTVYVGDLGPDPSFGTNIYMARWYGKNSLYVDWRQDE